MDAQQKPSVVSRVLCYLGFHPRGALLDDMTCGDCGRFVR